MKFRAHETFFLRKGWIGKGMKYVEQNSSVFVDRNNNPMDVLGIGSNMVKSLRYWLPALGLTQEATKGKRTQSFTTFGNCVFQNDRYIEESGTLQLLHYKLSANEEMATSWYFFFNEFVSSSFTREDFIVQLSKYIKMKDPEGGVADRSINDDFTCIINTYVPRSKSNPEKVSPENNIDCPLGELGLIDIINKDRNNWLYRKATPMIKSFNPWVLLAIIYDNANDRKEIPLNELLLFPKNIGKTFNMDSITMIEALRRAERTGELKIVRTAGLDVVQLSGERTFQECVDKYYQEVKEA